MWFVYLLAYLQNPGLANKSKYGIPRATLNVNKDWSNDHSENNYILFESRESIKRIILIIQKIITGIIPITISVA